MAKRITTKHSSIQSKAHGQQVRFTEAEKPSAKGKEQAEHDHRRLESGQALSIRLLSKRSFRSEAQHQPLKACDTVGGPLALARGFTDGEFRVQQSTQNESASRRSIGFLQVETSLGSLLLAQMIWGGFPYAGRRGDCIL